MHPENEKRLWLLMVEQHARERYELPEDMTGFWCNAHSLYMNYKGNAGAAADMLAALLCLPSK